MGSNNDTDKGYIATEDNFICNELACKTLNNKQNHCGKEYIYNFSFFRFVLHNTSTNSNLFTSS